MSLWRIIQIRTIFSITLPRKIRHRHHRPYIFPILLRILETVGAGNGVVKKWWRNSSKLDSTRLTPTPHLVVRVGWLLLQSGSHWVGSHNLYLHKTLILGRVEIIWDSMHKGRARIHNMARQWIAHNHDAQFVTGAIALRPIRQTHQLKLSSLYMIFVVSQKFFAALSIPVLVAPQNKTCQRLTTKPLFKLQRDLAFNILSAQSLVFSSCSLVLGTLTNKRAPDQILLGVALSLCGGAPSKSGFWIWVSLFQFESFFYF